MGTKGMDETNTETDRQTREGTPYGPKMTLCTEPSSMIISTRAPCLRLKKGGTDLPVRNSLNVYESWVMKTIKSGIIWGQMFTTPGIFGGKERWVGDEECGGVPASHGLVGGVTVSGSGGAKLAPSTKGRRSKFLQRPPCWASLCSRNKGPCHSCIIRSKKVA